MKFPFPGKGQISKKPKVKGFHTSVHRKMLSTGDTVKRKTKTRGEIPDQPNAMYS